MIACKFCGKECKSINSKAQHELYCKSNPDRKHKIPSYGMLGKKGLTTNNQWSKHDYAISESTRQKLITAGKNQTWSDERKAKHSASMKLAVENNPESYTSSNRGRTKQITYEGIKFQGSWELDFYKWCVTNKISCIRNTEGFKYTWNGERTYYPDFYLSDLDLYIEVKGYKTERDIAKWEQFPKRLRVIEKHDIILARKNELLL
jgi:hypothetical protein